MEFDINKMVYTLLELQNASKLICADLTEENYKKCTGKYEIPLTGEKANHFNSDILKHSLRTKFHVDINDTDFDILLLQACKILNFECVPLKNANDKNTENPTIIAYQVCLL